MPTDVLYGKTLRKSFARTPEIMDMPNLLEIQKSSYEWFLNTGLKEVFQDVDTVSDYSGNLELSFIDYSMNDEPKYSEAECKARDATYARPLKVRVRLRNKETEEIKEQEIFMGDFPVMTAGGTFMTLFCMKQCHTHREGRILLVTPSDSPSRTWAVIIVLAF